MQQLSIVEYEDRYKDELLNISLDWLERLDLLEDIDFVMLKNPKEEVLDKGGHVFFALMGEEVAGTVSLDVLDTDTYEVLKLGVKPKFHRLGIARKLMEHAIQVARSENKKKLMLSSSQKQKPALKLYETLGFQYIPYKESRFELSDTKMELDL